MTSNPYATYRNVEATTADPVTLTTMLYDGCVKALKKAVIHLESGNRNGFNDETNRAYLIIGELASTLEDWLLPFLSKVSRLSHFANLDLPGILAGQLPWPLPQRLDELAPKHLQVPSGSRIAIDYVESPPVLAVRLQELFGATATPT
ncbi:MAG TPA: ATP-dependent helicase C-terminal domain-containing protein, partial [Tepidiformaceae bacterium]|nr:ATP-dependent helicase C-terminal domain-containing protein [Tepidiformaceae bacterium]